MTNLAEHDHVRALRWTGTELELLDQRRLPAQETWISCRTAVETAAAIRELVVRGAPAIGIAAAYGIVLAARGVEAEGRTVDADVLSPAFEVLRG